MHTTEHNDRRREALALARRLSGNPTLTWKGARKWLKRMARKQA